MGNGFKRSILSIAFFIVLSCCQGTVLALGEPLEFPNARFAVISDPHYYDPSLGTTGKAFEDYLDNDRKLLKESRELLGTAISTIARSDAQFVLIPGDLTKDGELVNHRYVAAALRRLQDSGKKVFIIPGNHDINNPDAMKYQGDTAIPIPTVTPDEFVKIYGSYGYNTAVKRDTASLSYVAEPVPGLWLIALDSCRYDENKEKGKPVVGGKIKPQTLAWLEGVLKEAKKSGKAVMAMMHHGILPHFSGQTGKFKDYIVADNSRVAELMSKNGCRLVFTGHFHAQDITTAMVAGGAFHDVETGSLVTYPNPWRSVELMSGMIRVSTENITSIPSHPNLPSYSLTFTKDGLMRNAGKTLRKYKVRAGSIALMAPQIADRFIMHYKGDEPRGLHGLNLKGLDLWGKIIALVNYRLMRGLVSDKAPEDLNVFLSM